jgi:zinc transport system substrate-binding protein
MSTKKAFLSMMILSVLILMTACGGAKPALVSGKVNVVTSFYPLYDFAAKIGGDHVNVVNLVPTGVEPHDWTPKSKDIKLLTDAEIFLYLGAGFEGWVGDTLSSLKKDAKVSVVETSKGITLLPGIEDEHAHEEKGHDHGKEASESEYDPHVWTTPTNAKILAQNIKDALVKTDPAHQSDYEANFKQLTGKLDQLHEQYKTELGKTSKKEIVVTHQSFGYLAKEYGLTQKAIMGLAPDAEPTSRVMKDILQFIKDNDVKYIFFEELVSDKLAKTLAKDAKVETLVLNPMEGITEEQAKQGLDYISLMENNLKNLVKALQ